jgi:hypothetical protein
MNCELEQIEFELRDAKCRHSALEVLNNPSLLSNSLLNPLTKLNKLSTHYSKLYRTCAQVVKDKDLKEG